MPTWAAHSSALCSYLTGRKQRNQDPNFHPSVLQLCGFASQIPIRKKSFCAQMCGAPGVGSILTLVPPSWLTWGTVHQIPLTYSVPFPQWEWLWCVFLLLIYLAMSSPWLASPLALLPLTRMCISALLKSLLLHPQSLFIFHSPHFQPAQFDCFSFLAFTVPCTLNPFLKYLQASWPPTFIIAAFDPTCLCGDAVFPQLFEHRAPEQAFTSNCNFIFTVSLHQNLVFELRR